MKVSVSARGPTGGHAGSVQCHAELEVEDLDQHNIDRMVELAKKCDTVVSSATTGSPRNQSTAPYAATGNSNGDNNHDPRLATEKQVKAIHAIASRHGVELASLLHNRFGISSVSALSIKDASSLIDELKGNQAGA